MAGERATRSHNSACGRLAPWRGGGCVGVSGRPLCGEGDLLPTRQPARDAAVVPDLDVVDLDAMASVRRKQEQAEGLDGGVELLHDAEGLGVGSFFEVAEELLDSRKIPGIWCQRL